MVRIPHSPHYAKQRRRRTKVRRFCVYGYEHQELALVSEYPCTQIQGQPEKAAAGGLIPPSPPKSDPKTDHKFKSGVSFDKVLDLYRFDKKLRVLIFNEVEKVEIAVREAIVNVTAEISGDKFWITSPSSYKSSAFFISTMEKIDTEYIRSTEDFIEHFKKTYSDPYPPAWILAEILPMGNLMQLFRNLSDQRIRKAIAQKFGMQAPLLESWMTTLTLTRNACCHHSRVWNKVNAILPASPKKISGPWISTIPDQRRVYYNLCILRYFLIQIAPNNDLTDKLKVLFAKFPQIDLSAMGFPDDWDNEPLWK